MRLRESEIGDFGRPGRRDPPIAALESFTQTPTLIIRRPIDAKPKNLVWLPAQLAMGKAVMQLGASPMTSFFEL